VVGERDVQRLRDVVVVRCRLVVPQRDVEEREPDDGAGHDDDSQRREVEVRLEDEPAP
jgi:hypothetical protein